MAKMNEEKTWKCGKCNEELKKKRLCLNIWDISFHMKCPPAQNAERSLYQRNWRRAGWQRWRSSWRINSSRAPSGLWIAMCSVRVG